MMLILYINLGAGCATLIETLRDGVRLSTRHCPCSLHNATLCIRLIPSAGWHCRRYAGSLLPDVI